MEGVTGMRGNKTQRSMRERESSSHILCSWSKYSWREFEEIKELKHGNLIVSLCFLTDWICVISLPKFFKLDQLFVNNLLADKKHSSWGDVLSLSKVSLEAPSFFPLWLSTYRQNRFLVTPPLTRYLVPSKSRSLIRSTFLRGQKLLQLEASYFITE